MPSPQQEALAPPLSSHLLHLVNQTPILERFCNSLHLQEFCSGPFASLGHAQIPSLKPTLPRDCSSSLHLLNGLLQDPGVQLHKAKRYSVIYMEMSITCSPKSLENNLPGGSTNSLELLSPLVKSCKTCELGKTSISLYHIV